MLKNCIISAYLEKYTLPRARWRLEGAAGGAIMDIFGHLLNIDTFFKILGKQATDIFQNQHYPDSQITIIIQ